MNDTNGQLMICGDVCPVASNVALFSSGDVTELLGEDLIAMMEGSAGVLCNLETPLTNREAPILKSGPNLIAPTSAVEALRRLPLVCVGLANNHVLDQGAEGLGDTIATLDAAGIPHVGAGEDLSQARHALVVDAAGMRIGIYACAEHEFTIAGPQRAGANPFDPLDSLGDITDLAARCDRVIVLFHGMKEHYRYPSPGTLRRCRAMVRAGASAVLCQHSHCIGCAEVYEGSPILYGQGDFCFTKGDEVESRKAGLVALYEPITNHMEYTPVSNDGRLVRSAGPGNAVGIMRGFEERSHQIQEEGFVESRWAAFCEGLQRDYALQVASALEPTWFTKALRAWWKLRLSRSRFRSGKAVSALLNLLQCEAHNEALRTLLEKRLNG